MKITRAIRFEVSFPDWRRADLDGMETVENADGQVVKRRRKAQGQVGSALWPDLHAAMRDLGRANTLVAQVLWSLELGLITLPLGKDGKSMSPRGAAYQLYSGAWIPQAGGHPAYDPKGPRLAGGVLAAASYAVQTRLKTERAKLRQGERSLPRFGASSIPFRAQECRVLPNLDVEVKLWARGGRGPLRLRGSRLDGSRRAILRRLADGELKLGGGHLSWDDRRKKWFLSLVWSGEVEHRQGPLIAGVHLGMTTTCSVAYVDGASGAVQRKRDLVQISEGALRAVDRDRADREQRRQNVRGGGRGRQRAWRHEAGSTKGERIAQTAVQQVAARVVEMVRRMGATAIGVEDLTRWSVDRALSELPDATARVRAQRVRWYLRWHQGALRDALKMAAEGTGLAVVEVDAAYDSRTCCQCGKKYTTVETIDGKSYGRIEWRRFTCTCGCNEHADRNAAVNVAKRTREMLREAPESPAPESSTTE